MVTMHSKIKSVVTRSHTVLLNGEDIIRLLGQELAAEGGERVPAGATVTFTAPTGHYSGDELDVDEDYPVAVRWTTIEEE